MLDLLSFYILGTWVGYVSTRVIGKEPSNYSRIGYSALFLVWIILVLLAMGVSPTAAGRWSVFAAFGTYVVLGIGEKRLRRLASTWAGIWLFALFIVLEIGRSYLIDKIAAK